MSCTVGGPSRTSSLALTVVVDPMAAAAAVAIRPARIWTTRMAFGCSMIHDWRDVGAEDRK